MNIQDRKNLKQQIIIDGHNKYVKEWNQQGEAGVGLLWFCQYMMYIDGFMEKYLDLSQLPTPKDGGEKEIKMHMKRYILQGISLHYAGAIDLHSKSPFDME